MRWKVDIFRGTARFDTLERCPQNRRPHISDFFWNTKKTFGGRGGFLNLCSLRVSKRESFAAAGPKAKVWNNYKTVFEF